MTGVKLYYCGEGTGAMYETDCREDLGYGLYVSYADYAALQAALRTKQPAASEGDVLPEPCGWVRTKNDKYELRIGKDIPPDRSNGNAGPWVAIFDTPSVLAALTAAIDKRHRPAVMDAPLIEAAIGTMQMTLDAQAGTRVTLHRTRAGQVLEALRVALAALPVIDTNQAGTP